MFDLRAGTRTSYDLAAFGVRVKIVEPGMTKSDFGGRSLIFSADESLPEYAPVVTNTMNGFAAINQAPAEASDVAETIFAAATDGGDRLRYPSGNDAKMLIDMRRDQDDPTFTRSVKSMFNL